MNVNSLIIKLRIDNPPSNYANFRTVYKIKFIFRVLIVTVLLYCT